MTRYLPLIVFGVMLNAAAQLALKQGMRQIGYFEFHIQNTFRICSALAVNPFIFAGLTCYVISVAVWLMVLSRVEVSYAYPLLSIGYIVAAFAGRMFFHENLSLTRWAGIVVICAGVWLITRSA